jgi:hypothetical protein
MILPGILASGISGHLAPPLAAGSYESIATVTVGSGGTPTISFATIPTNFKHLQLRGIYRCSRSAASPTDAALIVSINGSSTGDGHNVYGNGSSANSAHNGSGIYGNNLDIGNGNNATAGIFTAT